ncbi:uncharacterized protein LOC119594803 [Penaeus monodon]|uniref:uncharacterized protein LOC119594803 n=1 Tax=Penaeus monodon TaxID=6687 RepID=UPI0018A7B803|nr:uncharacterized protein LOC119594803 [Penaeus monodon]
MDSCVQPLGLGSLPSSHMFLLQPRLLLLLLLFLLVGGQEPPPNYSHDLLPETNFTCSDKATGGYYADPEAGCQMFHVCVRVSDEEIRDFKFLCPNDTVFDQQNFICANWRDIDCKRSTRYYSKNDLFRVDESAAEEEYETESSSSVFYEDAYEYGDLQGRNSPEYVYEYYEYEADHRFSTGAGGRKGKSQDGDAAQSPNPPLPFRPAFRLGKPVVSISSSSASGQAAPPAPDRASRPEFSGRLESFLADDHEDEDNLFQGVSDPFASYDWRRDSSGVTASTKTTYEQRFGTGPRSRPAAPLFSPASRNQEFTSTTARNREPEPPAPTTERAEEEAAWTGRRRGRPSSGRGTSRYSSFANFRYYKTVLENGNSGSAATPQDAAAGARVRPSRFVSSRSASRNTSIPLMLLVMVTECAMREVLASQWKEKAKISVSFTVRDKGTSGHFLCIQ